MEYLKIGVPDRNDAMIRVSLDGNYFYLRTTWNEEHGFWFLSLYDAHQNLLVGMTKLAPGCIWNFFYRSVDGLDGAIGVKTDQETIGRNDFVDGIAQLIYIPQNSI